MLFSRKQPLVGIDIGTHTVKLVQLKRVGKGYQLLHFGMMPLMPESIVDGIVTNESAVVDAIRNLVQMEKIKTKDVATAISGQSVIVKKIRVPEMTDKELAENIHWEAEQHIPFELSDVNIDFQRLPSTETSEASLDNQVDVLLVAARRSKIEDYQNLLIASGLQPVVVDTDIFALENEFEVNNDLADEVVALVDIGASTTNINILKGGITLFQRDIAIGGNKYTAAIREKLSVTYEQAENLKKGAGFDTTIGKEDILPLMATVSEEICEEIQRSLEFFRSTTSDTVIGKMVLSGGCALIKGLDQFLSSQLGLPVELADPFRNVQYSEKTFDPEYIQTMAPVAAVGVGLALRRINDA